MAPTGKEDSSRAQPQTPIPPTPTEQTLDWVPSTPPPTHCRTQRTLPH
jgi:hypothetical protein